MLHYEMTIIDTPYLIPNNFNILYRGFFIEFRISSYIFLNPSLQGPIHQEHQQIEYDEDDEVHYVVLRPPLAIIGQT